MLAHCTACACNMHMQVFNTVPECESGILQGFVLNTFKRCRQRNLITTIFLADAINPDDDLAAACAFYCNVRHALPTRTLWRPQHTTQSRMLFCLVFSLFFWGEPDGNANLSFLTLFIPAFPPCRCTSLLFFLRKRTACRHNRSTQIHSAQLASSSPFKSRMQSAGNYKSQSHIKSSPSDSSPRPSPCRT